MLLFLVVSLALPKHLFFQLVKSGKDYVFRGYYHHSTCSGCFPEAWFPTVEHFYIYDQVWAHSTRVEMIPYSLCAALSALKAEIHPSQRACFLGR